MLTGDKLIGILTRLITRKPSMRGPISGRDEGFFSSPKCSGHSGAHLFFYSMYTRASFFRTAKRPVREADHWHPSGTESKYERSYTSTLKRFYGVHRVKFSLHLP